MRLTKKVIAEFAENALKDSIAYANYLAKVEQFEKHLLSLIDSNFRTKLMNSPTYKLIDSFNKLAKEASEIEFFKGNVRATKLHQDTARISAKYLHDYNRKFPLMKSLKFKFNKQDIVELNTIDYVYFIKMHPINTTMSRYYYTGDDQPTIEVFKTIAQDGTLINLANEVNEHTKETFKLYNEIVDLATLSKSANKLIKEWELAVKYLPDMYANSSKTNLPAIVITNIAENFKGKEHEPRTSDKNP